MDVRSSTALVSLTLCLSVFWLPSAGAQIYEYIDSAGVSHYTNVPTRKKGYRRVRLHGESSRPRPAAAPRAKSQRRPDSTQASGYDVYLFEAARLYQLPVAFLRAVMQVESQGNPNVVSVDGAMGLMQLMPFTAERMGVTDPFDPRQNILGGARFLRILANQWGGDLVLTVASYNAGAGAVERYQGVPPFSETRRYVNRVLRLYHAYRAGTATGG